MRAAGLVLMPLLATTACVPGDQKGRDTSATGADDSHPDSDSAPGPDSFGETGDSDGEETADSDGPDETGDTGGGSSHEVPRGTWDVNDADAIFTLPIYNVSYDLEAADVTGDGKAEVFLIDDRWDPDGTVGYVVPGPSALASTSDSTDRDGLIWLYNDNRHGLWTPSLTFGPIGDIDGDGIPDVAFPQPMMMQGPYVYSGATLTTDHYTDGGAPTSEADLTVEGADALRTGTELRLTAQGAPSRGGTLQVSTWADGTGGGTVYLFPLPQTGSSLALDDASATIETSRAVDATGNVDVDGDGVPELLDLSSWQEARSADPVELYVFDLPADGSTVTEADARTTVSDPVPAGVSLENLYTALIAGDLDGDGLEDVVVAHPCHDGTDEGVGRGVVAGLTSFSSLSGSVELGAAATWSIYGNSEYSAMGASAAIVPDGDADGLSEVVAYSVCDTVESGDPSPSYYYCREVYLSTDLTAGGSFDESDGAVIYRSTRDDHARWPVAAADLDGDDHPEILIQYSDYTVDGGAYIFSW